MEPGQGKKPKNTSLQGVLLQTYPSPQRIQLQETRQQIESPINTQQQQSIAQTIPQLPPIADPITKRSGELKSTDYPSALAQKSPRRGPPRPSQPSRPSRPSQPSRNPEKRALQQSQLPFAEQKEAIISQPPKPQLHSGQQQQPRVKGADAQPPNSTLEAAWKRNHYVYPSSQLISCTADFGDYRKTEIIERLTKERYGPGIYVIGCKLQEIRAFWTFIGYEVVNSIEEPQIVGKAKVDVGYKTYQNYSPADNEAVVSKMNSNNNQRVPKPKSVTLQVPKTQAFPIGGSTGLSADPGFFNLAEGAGIGAKEGFTSSHGFHQVDNEESLSQSYMYKEVVNVPPGVNVKAKVTTWAVTYEANTITKFTVDAHAMLPVRYRSRISRLIGGCFMSTGYLTAIDLFEDEDNFQFDSMENIGTFTRKGRVSYLGEEVDVQKNDTKIPTSFDDDM